jgi:hypothetical protein
VFCCLSWALGSHSLSNKNIPVFKYTFTILFVNIKEIDQDFDQLIRVQHSICVIYILTLHSLGCAHHCRGGKAEQLSFMTGHSGVLCSMMSTSAVVKCQEV